jgi:hypothetical protein
VPVVKDLVKRGVIKIVHGPYERRFPQAGAARPSEITFDSSLFTFDSSARFSDLVNSMKHAAMVEIIGKSEHWDALHLDSAYKSNVDAFLILTPDKRDIATHAERLEPLLEFRIFLLPRDNDVFKAWAEST